MSDDLNFKGNQLDEQPTWPQLRDKVAAAFASLAGAHIYTSTAIVGSSGDGEQEVREQLEEAAEEGEHFIGYAYYNATDEKEGRAYGTLSINIGSYVDADTWEQEPAAVKAISDKVVATLKAQDLKVEAPGDILPNLMTVSLA